MVKHIDEKDFDKEIKGGIKIVDFFATWCGPCVMLGPELETLCEMDNSIDVLKIDVDKNENIARKYRVQVIPTLLFFKDGKLAFTEQGFFNAQELLKMVERLEK